MRIAILDLGTNTFHCLIVSVSKKGVCKQVFKSKSVVKLGEGAIHKNSIAPIPFARGVKTIQHYHSILLEHKPEQVFAFATSAIRSADNGIDFVEAVKVKTGIEIQVISGDREAELIYLGVRSCVELDENPVLIMDIGGGSTEFIIANHKEIFWKQSFNIGAARLLEMFKPSDPVTNAEIESICSFLILTLEPLIENMKRFSIQRLVGSSGSFDTFAEMIGHRFHDKNVIKNKATYDFSLDEFLALHQVLLLSKTRTRKKMKGLVKMRVDLIVIASICTELIVKQFGLSKMTLSKFALKEGALMEILSLQNQNRSIL